MKRSIRWSILMAVLGFILGLGLLVPVGNEEGRSPASAERAEAPFILVEPKNEVTAPLTDSSPVSVTTAPEAPVSADADPDRRAGAILFDVHTIAKGKMARNVDAWVQPWITKDGSFAHFLYCHNYDYRRGRANTALDRYAAIGASNAFRCHKITIDDLRGGYALLDTPIGQLLTLKAKHFDPKKGGTLSVIFTYRIATAGLLVGAEHDYRSLDIIYRMRGTAIFGPKGEAFNWMNIRMHESLGVPAGVDSFETWLNGKIRHSYDGKNFPSVPAP